MSTDELAELREGLKDTELKEQFYRELGVRFNIRDRSTMRVIEFMLEYIILGEKINDWRLMKTLYARAKVRTSLNEFYYSIVPRLVSIGFLEMKMLISPSGELKRVIRLCEPFVHQVLCPIAKNLKNEQ